VTNSGAIPVPFPWNPVIPEDSGGIPVIPADSGGIPVDSCGISGFRTESVGHCKVLRLHCQNPYPFMRVWVALENPRVTCDNHYT
jgi:hypothetical protein